MCTHTACSDLQNATIALAFFFEIATCSTGPYCEEEGEKEEEEELTLITSWPHLTEQLFQLLS